MRQYYGLIEDSSHARTKAKISNFYKILVKSWDNMNNTDIIVFFG